VNGQTLTHSDQSKHVGIQDDSDSSGLRRRQQDGHTEQLTTAGTLTVTDQETAAACS
jgi:hypothetical protein